MKPITNKSNIAKFIASFAALMVLLFCATSVTAQDEDVKSEIETLIQKIRSITIQEIQPEPVEENQASIIDLTIDPNSIETPTDPNEADQQQQIQTIDLDTIVKNQANIENPFQLAELLYANKKYDLAHHCYQKALQQLNDNPTSNNDKVWIMVQMGNCLKHDQPDKAIETYNMIMKNHPLSIWANYASVQIQLSKWYIKENPKQLIAK